MSGGGGSSNTYYENLNELYGKQGAQLDRLMQIQDRNVIPGYDRLSTEAQQSGGIEEQNQAAGNVITQGRAELAAAKEATSRDLESMGVNPNDRRFVGLERGNDVAGAAQIASAANQARQGVKATGFARRKDVIGMGMGIPGQASETMASMGNTIGQQIAGRNQQQAAANAGLTSLGTLGTMALMMRDGGKVCRRGIRMAGGGPVGGFFQPINAPQAPASNAQQPQGTGLNPVSAMIMARGIKGSTPIGDKLAMAGEKLNAAGGHIAAKLGNLTGNDELTRQGLERVMTSRGLDAQSAHNLVSGPQGLMPAQQTPAYTTPVSGSAGGIPEITGAAPSVAATPAAETGIGSLPGSVTPAAEAFGGGLGEAAVGEGVTLGADTAIGAGGAAGAEGLGAAGATAAGSGAAGAGTAAMAALSSAMPWIGAGIAVGSLLGLFSDGGKVDMRSGGDVSGPGSSTSDSIQAHLSDGEYVLNAEAVRMIGEKKLNLINAAGLAARKGIRMDSGGLVSSGGSLAEGIVRGLGITNQMQAQEQERQMRDLQMTQAQLGIEKSRTELEQAAQHKRVWSQFADLVDRYGGTGSPASYAPASTTDLPPARGIGGVTNSPLRAAIDGAGQAPQMSPTPSNAAMQAQLGIRNADRPDLQQEIASAILDRRAKDPNFRASMGLYQRPQVFENAEFLGKAANLFLKAGMPEGVQWLDHANKAQKEGYIAAGQRLMVGDAAGAEAAFNGSGLMRVQPGSLKQQSDGTWSATLANGTDANFDVRGLMRSMLSPKDFFEAMAKEEAAKELVAQHRETNAIRRDEAASRDEARKDNADIRRSQIEVQRELAESRRAAREQKETALERNVNFLVKNGVVKDHAEGFAKLRTAMEKPDDDAVLGVATTLMKDSRYMGKDGSTRAIDDAKRIVQSIKGTSTAPADAAATGKPAAASISRFGSAEDVRAAYRAGRLDRAQAIKELQTFGYR